MSKNIDKIVSKTLNSKNDKYSQKLLDNAKRSAAARATKVATDAFKTALKE